MPRPRKPAARRGGSARRLPPSAPPIEVTIERIGARGDGTAAGRDGRPVFVPLTLPGERWLVQPEAERADGLAARPVELIQASPERADPPCPHFGPCGGCALQHWAPRAYADWKRGLAAIALGRVGLKDVPIGPLVSARPETRRHVTLSALRLGRGVVAGFIERGSSRVVDLTTCRIALPEITAFIPALRAAAGDVLAPGDRLQAVVNRLDHGLDVLLGLQRPPGLAERERLVALARDADLCRLAWRGDTDPVAEPIAERRPPSLDVGGVPVAPPPGAFLQATADGEAAIRSAVEGALAGSRHVADLYAGIGTLALPLAAAGMQVRAIEGDAAAVAALDGAARSAALASRLIAERRDLVARPLGTPELAGFDAVILDPPRAGARPQAERLAEAGPRLVVYISCSPATFARDARILVDGGYSLESLTPIDQFLWSAHLELVAVLRRAD